LGAARQWFVPRSDLTSDNRSEDRTHRATRVRTRPVFPAKSRFQLRKQAFRYADDVYK
jgi:hypothetical protein